MSQPSPVRRFFGAALIGVGFMMMLLCGGCGAIFFVGILVDELRHATQIEFGTLLMPIVLGGLPAAIGLGLFIAGRSLRRPATAPQPPGNDASPDGPSS